MSRILAFLTAIAKPVIDLVNNIIDPAKKRQRKAYELQQKIKKMEEFIEWSEYAIKAAKSKDKKLRYCERLSIALDTRKRLRKELEQYKKFW